MIFNKDYGATEEGRSRTAEVLAAKHTASLQLLCTVGGNQARLDARSEFKISFSERSKILNSVRASNLAWLPLTVHSNCSEAVCLATRTLLLQCRDLR